MRIKKIDMHAHAVSSHGFPHPWGDFWPTPEDLVGMYGEMNIERSVLMPMICTEFYFETSTNREIKEITERYPQNFSWFCNIDPRQGRHSPNTDFKPVIEHYKALGAKGVGELCSNLYFDDPLTMNLFYHCEQCNMPVTFHIGNKGGDYGLVDEFNLPRLEKVLKTFPDLILIGHSQKFWAEISGDVTPETRNGYPKGKVTLGGRVPELLAKYPNMYADLSAGSGAGAMMRDPEHAYAFLEQFKDKLFFGTDICTSSFEKLKGGDIFKFGPFLDDAVDNGYISEDAYYKICRGNAEKLLGLK